MSTWLFTIAEDYASHWAIAQENVVWDVPTPRPVQAGDQLYFSVNGGTGIVGRAVAAQNAEDLNPGTTTPWLDAGEGRTYTTRIDLQWAESLPPIDISVYPALQEMRRKARVLTGRPLPQRMADALQQAFGVPEESLVLGDPGDEEAVDFDQVVLSDEDLAAHQEDRRRLTHGLRVLREDRARFSRLLFERDRACVVTGTTDRQVLQGAHIEPYRGAQSNAAYNGLTLRADIHILFDRHLLTIVAHDGGWTTRVDPRVGDERYRALDGRAATPGHRFVDPPSAQLLAQHNKQCPWLRR